MSDVTAELALYNDGRLTSISGILLLICNKRSSVQHIPSDLDLYPPSEVNYATEFQISCHTNSPFESSLDVEDVASAT